MRILTLSFIILLFFAACNKKQLPDPKIIPLPKTVETSTGTFEISEKTTVSVSDDDLKPLANLLMESITSLLQKELVIQQEPEEKNSINIQLVQGMAEEEYHLSVQENVELRASNYKSLAMGLATLIQAISINGGRALVPKMKIIDSPDYNYRAVMLDVARMWHPVETIKETIDLLWLYKVPYLLLHLSDNRKVTFPFDRYPKLQTLHEDGRRWYYTKEELNELVEYAKQRGIAIIPEIDLPGHSGQMFTQYPGVFGHVDQKTGKAKYLYVINIAKEEAYEAGEYIIKELADVFYTAPYINLGADEVYLEILKTLPEYQSFCEKHNLKEALNGNANELFCHFINRMHKVIKATGKKTLVWEGFHGSGAGSETISKEVDVIVWNTTYNHPDSLRKNAYKIINSTWVPWYLVGAMNLAAPQEKAYNWNVTDWSHWNKDIPNIQLDSEEGILGGQISFWEQNHFKVIPQLQERVPVFAQRLWNIKSNKSFEAFQQDFKITNSLYERLFHPVAIAATNLIDNQDQTFTDEATIELKSDRPGTIKYTFSDSWTLTDLNLVRSYKQAFTIHKSGVLSTQLFDDNGNAIAYPVQKYYQKISPAYNYKLYGGPPQHGWEEMPDFSTLPLIGEGVSGLMTTERLEKINEELFAKVKKEGHIETRFNGIYNPYALELEATIAIPKSEEYTFRIQTWDGLAELYINDEPVAIGTDFSNKAEDFIVNLEKGKHEVRIKYYYKEIQNQLSILYTSKDKEAFVPFENLVLPLN